MVFSFTATSLDKLKSWWNTMRTSLTTCQFALAIAKMAAGVLMVIAFAISQIFPSFADAVGITWLVNKAVTILFGFLVFFVMLLWVKNARKRIDGGTGIDDSNLLSLRMLCRYLAECVILPRVANCPPPPLT